MLTLHECKAVPIICLKQTLAICRGYVLEKFCEQWKCTSWSKDLMVKMWLWEPNI